MFSKRRKTPVCRATAQAGMISPHGGKLINRVLNKEEREEAIKKFRKLPKIYIDNDRISEVVNISYGIFSPLPGFMDSEELRNVLDRMHLKNSLAWTIPIILSVSKEEASLLREGRKVGLYNSQGEICASLYLEEKYVFNKKKIAKEVFGTNDEKHPGVSKLSQMKEVFLAGKVNLINEVRIPFKKYFWEPQKTRKIFQKMGWKTIAGFQTRNIPHVGHEYVQKSALLIVDGIFINPVIGKKKKGDFRDEIILKSYEVLIKNYYPKHRAFMSIFPTEMRYAGPREAIHHAIVRKNFGCTHLLVGRDHAGVGNYYSPYAAQEIFKDFPDLEIKPIFFKSFFYCKKCGTVADEKTCPHNEEYRLNFSGTKIREILSKGKIPPKELMRPEVAEIIIKSDKLFVE